MRLDHLLSKETSEPGIWFCNVLRSERFGESIEYVILFNLEGTHPTGV